MAAVHHDCRCAKVAQKLYLEPKWLRISDLSSLLHREQANPKPEQARSGHEIRPRQSKQERSIFRTYDRFCCSGYKLMYDSRLNAHGAFHWHFCVYVYLLCSHSGFRLIFPFTETSFLLILLTCNSPNHLVSQRAEVKHRKMARRPALRSPPLFILILLQADAAHRKMALVPVLQLSGKTYLNF